MTNKVRQFRDELGMSQEELSMQVGITRPYLSNIETGNKKPSVFLALKIAKVLNKNVEDLFFIDSVHQGE